jgi:GDPmannose 4,6-dehydratase
MSREAALTRRALIIGITGQDGSYLAEHLLREGYEAWGLVRGQANPRIPRLRRLLRDIRFVQGDLLDQGSLIAAVGQTQPDEVYNLGAVSYVPLSWQQAEVTAEVTGMGVLRVLEAIRIVSGISGSRSISGGQMRFYQASSSEMFGQVYESYGMYAVSGSLFNHESPRRGAEFVTRKVSLGVARIKLGLARELRLGNLDARRDWGYAGDYVRAMHLMLQRDRPEDYVIGTGRMHSVRELVVLAFTAVGLDWSEHVVTDISLTRPAEVDLLCADPKKAREQLGWEPTVSFEELVATMVETDLKRLSASKHRSDEFSTPENW